MLNVVGTSASARASCRTRLALALLLLAPIPAQGQSGAAEAGLGDETPSTSAPAQTYTGKGLDEKPCTVTISRQNDGSLAAFSLSGTFNADYKIPTPGSGIYGPQLWEGRFSTAKNMAQRWQVHRSWLNDADVIEGDGHPLFWDGPVHHHKLVVKPNLAAPQTVTYEATQYLLGLPFVNITGQCNL